MIDIASLHISIGYFITLFEKKHTIIDLMCILAQHSDTMPQYIPLIWWAW